MASPKAQLAHDPTAGIECHRVDDRFIPLRGCDLAEAMVEHGAAHGVDRDECRAFIAAVSAVIEQEAGAFQGELDEAYSHFNPDRDTLPLNGDAAARTPAGYRDLNAHLRYLLDKANFEPLDDVAVHRAIQVASSYGIRVQLDPSRVEEFEIFVRGSGRIERRCRSWRAPIHGRPRTLPVYRRLVVIARLKDDPHVLLKMFKDIPEADVEALLPHAEVTMNWLDRLFMLGGGAGAVGSTGMQVAKIVSAGLLVLSRLLWVVLLGGLVLIWRTFTGYTSAKRKRDAQRTRHLYFQNVSNNGGTIHVLIHMTAQEEIKEAVVAYLLCATSAEPIASEAELGARVEQYLRERFGIRVDFDVADAVETLDRLALWQDRPKLRVLPSSAAIARLREHWQQRRSQHYHRLRCGSADRDGAVPAASVSPP